jgi:membrane protein YdbS with pleckstrin-like domain
MSTAYPESQETPAPPAEEEVEVWWGSYAGRTMVPGFLVCLLATTGLIIAVYAWGGARNPRQLAYLISSPLWLVQTGRWLYRMTAFNYRLTNRRLFVSRAFRTAADVVDLARVERVRVERGPLERRLGVGRVYVEAAGTPPLVLRGVLHPNAVAGQISDQVQQARAHPGHSA